MLSRDQLESHSQDFFLVLVSQKTWFDQIVIWCSIFSIISFNEIICFKCLLKCLKLLLFAASTSKSDSSTSTLFHGFNSSFRNIIFAAFNKKQPEVLVKFQANAKNYRWILFNFPSKILQAKHIVLNSK